MMPITLNDEPSSYRDREARVFYDDAGGVCRALSARALAEWDALRQTRFFQQAIETGHVVRTAEVPDAEIALTNVSGNWAGLLRHEVIPFVSYPFEWSFGMLQDAALLHLDLLAAALDEDFTLKDGTAYNLQWVGTRPVFIDVASLERLIAGRPWAGYRQFCQTFLYPLLLQAYKNVPFHPWLRGRLEGISPQECWNLMSFRDVFRRGVPSHVWLHSWLQSRRTLDEVDSTQALAAAGFRKDQIRANVQGLQRLVRGLRWSPVASAWSEYAGANSYSAADRQQKESFVRSAVQSRRWGLVWDVGCNTGNYSRIAAENSDQVVAIDADPLAIERLYQSLKSQLDGHHAPILPLVNNLTDLSGGLGWRGVERKALANRGRPELTLCLALVHHLVVGHGIPLRELLTWFADLGTSLVIEFITKDDPMVQRLLRSRRDNYADYEPEVFDRLLSEMFDVVRTETLASGTRKLYFAKARTAS
ncbi:MAG: methyltransferase [Planctomycetaceae bacterium]|nr:methyltransferase [Planctomycetaceae bacterium]